MGLSDTVLRITTDARAWARKRNLLAPLARCRSAVQRALGRASYEHAFNVALRDAVRPGDVVWDVGANVGLYTVQFAEAVGATGQVFAFEPVPACFAMLQQKAGTFPQVRVYNVALGDRNGSLPMALAPDQLGATHSLGAPAGKGIGATIDVAVRRGDELVAGEGVAAPNVLKIDVEGFEEEVVRGLGELLSLSTCRSVLIEIHFAILDMRGERHAPARVRSILEGHGFRVRWTDSSHLAAERG